MGPNDVLDVARDAIFVTLKVGAPIMAVALLVGLIVSLLQPFMLSTLTGFAERMADRIVSLG
jgi:flagellar biosynthetic protein FliQ